MVCACRTSDWRIPSRQETTAHAEILAATQAHHSPTSSSLLNLCHVANLIDRTAKRGLDRRVDGKGMVGLPRILRAAIREAL